MSIDHTMTSDVNISSLCSPLQEIFRKLKDVETGCYSGDTLKDWGVRANNIPAESFIFSVRDPRFSVINTGDYADAKNKDMQIICIQGYADVKLFQKYSISSVLVGAEKTESLNSNNELLELVTIPHEERAILEQKRLTEAATTPAFYETITKEDTWFPYLYDCRDFAQGVLDSVNCFYGEETEDSTSFYSLDYYNITCKKVYLE